DGVGHPEARAGAAGREADEVPVLQPPAAREVGQRGDGAVAKARAPPGDEPLVAPEAPALAPARGVDRLEGGLAGRVARGDPFRFVLLDGALGADARVVAARPARIRVVARAPGEHSRRARGRDESE